MSHVVPIANRHAMAKLANDSAKIVEMQLDKLNRAETSNTPDLLEASRAPRQVIHEVRWQVRLQPNR
eukprot:365164-Chlamydomonas_euryale.AAC.5